MKTSTRLLALLLAVVMLLALAACGGDTTTTSNTDDTASNTDSTNGDTSSTGNASTGDNILRIGLAQDIETMDSQQNTAEYTQSVAEGVTATLLREHNGEYLFVFKRHLS